MKTYKVLVSHEVEVTLDETKFTEAFMQEFRDSHYRFFDVEDHAEHLGQLYARGIAQGWKDEFVEGYGCVADFGISFEDGYQETEIVEWKSYQITSESVLKIAENEQFQDLSLLTVYLVELSHLIHELNRKWWVDLETGEPKERNVGEMLMLVVSEIAEAMEGDRKNLMDDHLPYRKMIEVELADAVIRILDLGAGLELDVPGALAEKLVYNTTRKDHTKEARLQENGKKY